uniref:Uncharacterized protein n=1 Tax=Branchiostoma floridae TaxID=7739 RepID=C3YF55_BRAFL|eukprot:XP_002605047.1 hypothetical protein BRAFLDRAFT_85193 [Branchiostoma floridae]
MDRAGINHDNMDRAGINHDNMDRAGINHDNMDRAGINHDNMDRAGINHDNMDRAGINHDNMDRAGINHDNMDRAGINHDNMDRAGINHDNMDRAGINHDNMDRGSPFRDMVAQGCCSGLYSKSGEGTRLKSGRTRQWSPQHLYIVENGGEVSEERSEESFDLIIPRFFFLLFLRADWIRGPGEEERGGEFVLGARVGSGVGHRDHGASGSGPDKTAARRRPSLLLAPRSPSYRPGSAGHTAETGRETSRCGRGRE